MASTIKLKFAGFMRGLLRQSDEREPTRPVTPPAPAASSAQSPTPAPAAPSYKAAPSISSNTDVLDLPLAPIIAALPMDLKAKLMAHPMIGQMISVPVDTIVKQLAFGAVKLSFGELRQLAPGIFANSGGEHDNRQLSLPLQEILSRINPALLSRRSSQKIEVSEEVAGPFDGRGRGITFTANPLKAPTATPLPSAKGLSHPSSAPAAPQIPPPAAHRKVTPEPETFSFTPRQTAPPAAPIQFTPPAKPATPAAPAAPASIDYINGYGNGNGHGNNHIHGNGSNGHANGTNGSNGKTGTGLPPFKFSAAPVSPAPAASSAPRPESAQPTPSLAKLTVSLDELAENWPDMLKQEIGQAFGNGEVALPLAVIEPGLKKGRVTMSWKELRTFAKSNSAPSMNDGLMLDLPLKVLAPAFLSAQKKLGHGQRKVSVSSEIPNLFFGFPQSAPVAPATPVAPAAMAAPATPVESAPVPEPITTGAVDTNFFGSHDTVSLRMATPATDFLNRQMHPKDVVTSAMRLPTVAGAVISLADGLRVASEVPAEMNPETIAAFLPQIYDRVNLSTRELRMGPLNNVSFTVGNVAWKIFRVNSIYFAAFGRAGERLPKAQLAALAAELDRKK